MMKNMFGIDVYTSLSGKMRWCVLSHRVALMRNPVLIYLSALRKKVVQACERVAREFCDTCLVSLADRKNCNYSPKDLNKIAQGCDSYPVKHNNNTKLP